MKLMRYIILKRYLFLLKKSNLQKNMNNYYQDIYDFLIFFEYFKYFHKIGKFKILTDNEYFEKSIDTEKDTINNLKNL